MSDGEDVMEEIEIMSWLTLDGIKKSKAAEIVETIGNLQTGHCMAVFCIIEDDFLELCYSDSAANYLRRYEDRDEFEEALEERKEEAGEAPYEEADESDFDEDEEDEGEEEGGEESDFNSEEDSDSF
jgi:hypothetical protein